ncbi:MAG: hypothetical protein IPG50_21615 [Myxococcales bacterium]|nr:hypothetical protein [Myxococcales bacterium]
MKQGVTRSSLGAPAVLIAVALSLASCRAQKTAPRPVVDAGPVVPPPLAALVMGGEHAIVGVAWAGSSRLYAYSQEDLWRLELPSGKTTLVALPPGDRLVALAAAKGADVAVVYANTGDVHVVEGGRRKRSWVATKGAQSFELALSADGSIAATSGSGDAGDATSLVDVATGAPLRTLPGKGARFDGKARFVATDSGVFRVSDGRRVPGWSHEHAGGVWVGDVLVGVRHEMVRVLDPVAEVTEEVPTSCKSGGITVRETLDTIGRRVVVDCGTSVTVVTLAAPPARRSFPLPEPFVHRDRVHTGPGEPPEGFEPLMPLLVRGDDTVVVRRSAGRVAYVALDPATHAVRGLTALERPVLRSGVSAQHSGDDRPCVIGPKTSDVSALCSAVPSPDDRYAAAFGVDGGLSVLDLASGETRANLGVPQTRDTQPLALGVQRGVFEVRDYVNRDAPPRRLTRDDAGAARSPFPRRAPCSPRFTEHRALDEHDLYFSSEGACLCTQAKCARLPPPADYGLVVDGAGARVLEMASRSGTTTVRLVSPDGARAPSRELPDACYSAAMAHELVAVLCRPFRTKGATYLELLSAKTLEPVRRVDAPERVANVIGGGRRAVALDDSLGARSATLFDVLTGKRSARLYAWSFGAVARFEDGALEIFGDAEQAVVCLRGGEVVAGEKCGERAVGRFSLD